jgi:hypothetical protein
LRSLGQAHEGAVAAGGVGEGDDRRGVQVAVRGHELPAQLEPALEPSLLCLKDLDADEPWQHPDAALVQPFCQ